MSSKSHPGWKAVVLQGVLAFALFQACAPAPVYRPLPSRIVAAPRKVSRPPVVSPKPQPPPSPIFSDAIREEDLPLSRSNLRSGTDLSQTSVTSKALTALPQKPPNELVRKETPRAKEVNETRAAPLEEIREEGKNAGWGQEALSTEPEKISLLSMITPHTPPQRAASLRLTEEGRELLENQDYDKGLSRLEKALAIDSTNPYVYYHLAQAHHLLTHYTESLNFLEVTESRFVAEPYWQARVLVLKGENLRALGFLDEADENYARALKTDPGNRMALEGMVHIGKEMPSLSP